MATKTKQDILLGNVDPLVASKDSLNATLAEKQQSLVETRLSPVITRNLIENEYSWENQEDEEYFKENVVQMSKTTRTFRKCGLNSSWEERKKKILQEKQEVKLDQFKKWNLNMFVF